ncbi:hypothetical protein PDE_05471 [Penicillium oxalicum 114-2]|uniref:GPI anchored protein n=1 Tax=Penicillium oxalicum (strain 114-2 / CGMCC 5302) TaxID=933388 RepID=S7ZIQ5_PENO1|nr:hypothetical protein PDE_05471 [Penicillium oxalicum 114-2]
MYIAMLAAVGVATAQSSVVSLLIPDIDPQPLAASVVGQSSGSVTYSINCPSGTDRSECGMGPGMFYTSASNSIKWVMSEGDSFTAQMMCSVSGTTAAHCTEIMAGTEANFPGTVITDLAQSQMTYFPVTVTAGLTTTTGAAATATETSKTMSSGATVSATTGMSASSSGAAASATSSLSTGGLPRMTGSPRMVLGGAAAALVAAAL